MIDLQPRSFKAPLTQNQRNALAGVGDVFSDDFEDLVYRINPDGRKVLLVSDHPGSVMMNDQIFSGNERSVFHNVLKYALEQAEEKVKDVYFVSWPRATIDPGRRNKDDLRKLYTGNQIFLTRMLYIIGRLKPDVVIFCGIDPFRTAYKHFTDDIRYNFNLNRVLTAEVHGHTFQYLGTGDIFRPCSWDPKHRSFGQLLGWIVKGWRQAINGRADYTVKVDDAKFIYLDTIPKFDAFYKILCAGKVVAQDTEGSGDGRITSKLYSLQFAFDGRTGYFLPFEHPDTPFSTDELNYIRKKLRDYYERGTSAFHIWQYGKYDVTQLYANIGIRFYNHRIYDTMAARWALDENLKGLKSFGVKPNSLEFMTESDYNCNIYQTIPFSKGDRSNIGKVKLTKDVIRYGVYDALVIFQIQQFQRHEAKTQGYTKFLPFVTIQLGDKIIALAQMEFTGAPIDKKQIYKLAAADGPVAKTIKAMQEKFRHSPHAQKVNKFLLDKQGRTRGDMYGETQWIFDISKEESRDLLMFQAHKLKPLGLKKDGKGKIDKAFIAQYMKENKDVHALAELTKATTIKNNFVKILLKKIQEDSDTLKDNRIRASYTYTVVVGGRLSATDPNLQNIPVKDDKTFSEAFAKELKKAFPADKYCLIEAADYSANEIREWCNEAKDEVLAESFYQGMKMRREMRIHAYEFPDQLKSWEKFKVDHNWSKIEKKQVDGKEISVHAQKMALISTLNDPDVQKFGAIELSLSIAGDLHYVNASIAFQVDVLEVTDDQRYSIKAISFGKIYGKTLQAFAKSKAEGGLGYSEEECEQIIKRMFDKFAKGGQWLEDTQQFGLENLFIESPLGMRRHLWSYLHTRQAFINAMHRRGPNATIQGTASEIGVTTMRMLQWVMWHYFTKHGIPVYWKSVNNYVHDAIYSQAPIAFLPVYLYLREMCSTVLVHKYYEKQFNHKLIIGVEGESQIGANLARAKKWDFTNLALIEQVETEIKFQRESMGYNYTALEYDKMMKGLVHNSKIIADLRLRELKYEYENETRVAKHMLLNSGNARLLGFDYGMDFIKSH